MRRSLPCGAGLALCAGLALAACSDRGAAPPEGTEGAVGEVTVDNAGASENPTTPALSGGPAGQTPDYGAPGGAPSVVVETKDAAGPSVSSGDPPLN